MNFDDDEIHLDERGPRDRILWGKPRGYTNTLQSEKYPAFQKKLVANQLVLDQKKVDDFRTKHQIHQKQSKDDYHPWLEWTDTQFTRSIKDLVLKKNFKAPTPIQAAVFPIIMAGRDLIGVAQTGSGKTCAYLFPAFEHILAQHQLKPGDGPIVLILSPTRELCVQITEQSDYFGAKDLIRTAAVYGGASMQSQIHKLVSGVEIVVACPGRLLDLIVNREINLDRITYLVIDEADRMLDMGFEPQVRRIVDQIRPDRQTVYFSATWPHEVQLLAMDFCQYDPVQIQIGRSNLTINKDITQIVEVVRRRDKQSRLYDYLDQMFNNDKVLIFAETRIRCEELSKDLTQAGYYCLSLHGDKSQRERDHVMNELKKSDTRLVCATDIAARGLDVRDITVVINFDFPKMFDSYIHRIGRTGRAGAKGTSISFLTHEQDDSKTAKKLLQLLQEAGQKIKPDLEDFANGNYAPTQSFNKVNDRGGYRGNYRGRNDDRKFNDRGGDDRYGDRKHYNDRQGDKYNNQRQSYGANRNFDDRQNNNRDRYDNNKDFSRGDKEFAYDNRESNRQQRDFQNDRDQGRRENNDRFSRENIPQRGFQAVHQPQEDRFNMGDQKFNNDRDNNDRFRGNYDRGGNIQNRFNDRDDRGGHDKFNNDRQAERFNQRGDFNNNNRFDRGNNDRGNNDRGNDRNDRGFARNYRGFDRNDRGNDRQQRYNDGGPQNERGGNQKFNQRDGYDRNDRGGHNDRFGGNNDNRGNNDRNDNQRFQNRDNNDRGENSRFQNRDNDRGGNQRYNARDNNDRGNARYNDRDNDRGGNQRFNDRDNNERGGANQRFNDRDERGGANQCFNDRDNNERGGGNIRFNDRDNNERGRGDERVLDRQSDREQNVRFGDDRGDSKIFDRNSRDNDRGTNDRFQNRQSNDRGGANERGQNQRFGERENRDDPKVDDRDPRRDDNPRFQDRNQDRQSQNDDRGAGNSRFADRGGEQGQRWNNREQQNAESQIQEKGNENANSE